MSKPVANKPFHLIDRKSGPKNSVTETDVCQFICVLEANIKLHDSWKEYLPISWQPKNVAYRGFADANKADIAASIDGMLINIAGYSPPPLLRAITQRCKSLGEVWDLVRKWAGIQTSGLRLLNYSRLQNTWDSSGDITAAEFYYVLRDNMEDTLLTVNGKVKHEQQLNTVDEVLTPSLESVVVKDWLIAIGGQQLFEHICRVYSKDLEQETLASIQDRISQNLEALITDVEATTNYIQVAKTFSRINLRQSGFNRRGSGRARGNFRGNFRRGTARGAKIEPRQDQEVGENKRHEHPQRR